MGLLLNGSGKWVTNDTEKAKILHAFLASVFSDKMCLQELQDPEARVKVWNKQDLGGVFVKTIVRSLLFAFERSW